MSNLKKIILFIFILTSTLVANGNKILKPSEAFSVHLSKNDSSILVNIDLGNGIYIYKNKLHVELTEPLKQNLTEFIKLPKSEFFHNENVFRKDFKFIIPIEMIKKYAKDEDFTLKISWQGCSEAGLCYQPMEKSQTFSLNSKVKKEKLSEQDTIAKSFKSKSLFLVLLSFLGFGFLLSLTPCVFPMIPILSSIIVSNSGEKMDAKKGFFLSFVYVLAMSLAYSMVGVLAGVFGSNIQIALQNPYVIFTFSGIFVLLSLSMFGFYDLELPKSLQSMANKKSDKMKGKGVLGVAVMGFLSALIVGPCVAAPLAGALVYIGQSGDALLGGLALFIMGIGMGVPLLIIGASAGKFLPKPGLWMDRIKSIFGVLMLGVAIWMIQRVVSSEISMFLWATLFIASAVYMGVLEPLKTQNGWAKFLKSFSVLILLYGIIVFVGIFIGGGNVFSPLKGLHVKENKSLHVKENDFLLVKTLNQLNQQIANSKKPILIDFWATWCVSCQEMDEITFENEKVKKEFENFTLLRVDVTKNSDEDKKILKKFGIFGPPAIVFFKNKKELKNLQIVGFKNPDVFLQTLKRVASE